MIAKSVRQCGTHGSAAVRRAVNRRQLTRRGSVAGDGRSSLAVLDGAVTLAACAAFETVDYYWQGAAGQWDLLSRAQPIPDVIGKSDAALAARLQRIREIREFASRELGLPGQRQLHALHRSRPSVRHVERVRDAGAVAEAAAVVLSDRRLRQLPRLFPRGARRKGEATRLKAGGDDVYVGGVPAYSTLGWFDDPVLSSFVRWPETEVARLIFHELAHQLLYVKSDSVFNESFATAVEEAGLARWLARARIRSLSGSLRVPTAAREFRDLVRTTRAKLCEIYASPLSDDDKRRAKAASVAAMKAAYETAKAGEPGLWRLRPLVRPEAQQRGAGGGRHLHRSRARVPRTAARVERRPAAVLRARARACRAGRSATATRGSTRWRDGPRLPR